MKWNLVLRRIIWLMTAALMIFIFVLSSRSVDESRLDSARAMKMFGLVDEVEEALDLSNASMLSVHNAIRKYAHEIMYAVLGMLFFLSGYRLGKLKRTALSALLLSAVYGATDEFHQIFSKRGATLIDVGHDTFGAFCGILFLVIFFLIVEKHQGLRRFVNIFYDLEASEPNVKDIGGSSD